ncbi:MAG TPA: hypothetical protein VGH86_16760 [Phenylobacterium sp.]
MDGSLVVRIVIAAAVLDEPSARIGVVKIIGILGLLALGPSLACSKKKTDA